LTVETEDVFERLLHKNPRDYVMISIYFHGEKLGFSMFFPPYNLQAKSVQISALFTM